MVTIFLVLLMTQLTAKECLKFGHNFLAKLHLWLLLAR